MVAARSNPAGDAQSLELIDFLQEQRKAGLIRAFGLGSEFERLQGDAARVPEAYQVLQFENGLSRRNLRELSNKVGWTIFTHSALKHAMDIVHQTRCNPELATKLQQAGGIDLVNVADVCRLLLAWALTENRGGVVLFGSTSAKNIRCNAAVPGDFDRYAYVAEMLEEALSAGRR